MKIIENGKILEVESVEIKGITPEMMTWYSRHRDTERYKLWHPDHIEYKLVKDAPKGSYAGRVYHVTERFGKYLVVLKSTTGKAVGNSSTVLHRVCRGHFPIPLFNLRVSLEREYTSDGMILRATHVVGSDVPVIGRFWNWITRKFIYTPDFQAAYEKHRNEESYNFPKFLPKLYAEYADKEP